MTATHLITDSQSSDYASPNEIYPNDVRIFDLMSQQTVPKLQSNSSGSRIN